MNYSKLLNGLYYTGMVLVLLGTVASLVQIPWGGYLMAIGVAPIVGTRAYNRATAMQEHQRINSILLMSSLVLVCGVIAFFMKQPYWIVCMFTAAVLDGYSSFRHIA
ncbi:MAG: hypothetical protein QM786_03010 [Breznakibacter sp.]